jgi:hypothetical protein
MIRRNREQSRYGTVYPARGLPCYRSPHSCPSTVEWGCFGSSDSPNSLEEAQYT